MSRVSPPLQYDYHDDADCIKDAYKHAKIEGKDIERA
jgi:hypothetical protein